MASDAYIEFSGKNSFKGEAQDEKHKEQVEITSWSFGVSNSGSGAVGTGSAVGKSNFNDLSITKHVDKSSPNFFINCANGAHIDKAILHIRKAGETPVEYQTVTMEEVYISSFSHSGADGSGLPMESATLNFSKIEFKYSPQKKDGSLDAANPKGWSLKENKNYTA